MSNFTNIPSEKLCYLHCNVCSNILAVNVPCNNLFDVVTVRCGHCAHLWSVNMAAVLQSRSWQCQDGQSRLQTTNFLSTDNRMERSLSSTMDQVTPQTSIEHIHETIITTRPPSKRQRVPSAYNQFIKEEIQRIKAKNPEISHRLAFSTAAKNWAHFPHIHFGLTLETNNEVSKINEGPENTLRRKGVV